MMNGALDWNALPIVCDLFGVKDPDIFIHELLAIRDHLRLKAKADAK